MNGTADYTSGVIQRNVVTGAYELTLVGISITKIDSTVRTVFLVGQAQVACLLALLVLDVFRVPAIRIYLSLC